MKNKVMVFVRGGNVEGIYSNQKDTDVSIFDVDNLKAEGKTSTEIENMFEKEVEGLEVVY